MGSLSLEDPVSGFISCRPINTNPASEENFDRARSWLLQCKNGVGLHTWCKPPVQTFMPTHVLRLDTSTQSINLVHSTRIEPYAALSYCWGGDQPHKLTSRNYAEYSAKIDTAQLPTTIKDAVDVAKELGLQYLWIDSLCIIQDDPRDVVKEIAQMPDIYSQALVTISVSRAETVSEGFLHEIDSATFVTESFKLRFQCPNEAIGPVHLLGVPDGSVLISTLSRRGWTLQERCLSPRILDYGTFQIRWICNSSKSQKGFTNGWQRNEFGALSECDELRELDEDGFKVEEGNKEYKSGHILSTWRSLVKAYTHRDLSVSTDRILAISALAHRIGDMLQDQYLAGLWRSRLPFDLLWFVDEIFDGSRGVSVLRPAKYQGPSWSWVTVNSPVDFFSVSSENYSVCVIILDVNIRLYEPSAKYGSVHFGIIRVRGRVAEALWNGGRRLKCEDGALLEDYIYPDTLEREFVEQYSSEISDSTASTAESVDDSCRSHELEAEAEEDTLGALEQEKWIDVSLLKVCTKTKPDGQITFGLVLRDCRKERVGSPSVLTYTRLGTFQFFHPLSEVMRGGPVGFKERCERQRMYFDNCDEIVIEIQ